MSVQSISGVSVKKNNIVNYYNLVYTTGYGALGAGGLCLLQGMRHKKSHRIFGFLSVILASAHLALIEFLQRKAIKNVQLNKLV